MGEGSINTLNLPAWWQPSCAWLDRPLVLLAGAINEVIPCGGPMVGSGGCRWLQRGKGSAVDGGRSLITRRRCRRSLDPACGLIQGELGLGRPCDACICLR